MNEGDSQAPDLPRTEVLEPTLTTVFPVIVPSTRIVNQYRCKALEARTRDDDNLLCVTSKGRGQSSKSGDGGSGTTGSTSCTDGVANVGHIASSGALDDLTGSGEDDLDGGEENKGREPLHLSISSVVQRMGSTDIIWTFLYLKNTPQKTLITMVRYRTWRSSKAEGVMLTRETKSLAARREHGEIQKKIIRIAAQKRTSQPCVN